MRSIRAHSASVTGITDSRAMRTSGKFLKAASALIWASVTGRGSRLTGATSTATYFPLASSGSRSEEHTSELQSLAYLVCRLLLEKKKKKKSDQKAYRDLMRTLYIQANI